MARLRKIRRPGVQARRWGGVRGAGMPGGFRLGDRGFRPGGLDGTGFAKIT